MIHFAYIILCGFDGMLLNPGMEIINVDFMIEEIFSLVLIYWSVGKEGIGWLRAVVIPSRLKD